MSSSLNKSVVYESHCTPKLSRPVLGVRCARPLRRLQCLPRLSLVLHVLPVSGVLAASSCAPAVPRVTAKPDYTLRRRNPKFATSKRRAHGRCLERSERDHGTLLPGLYTIRTIGPFSTSASGLLGMYLIGSYEAPCYRNSSVCLHIAYKDAINERGNPAPEAAIIGHKSTSLGQRMKSTGSTLQAAKQ